MNKCEIIARANGFEVDLYGFLGIRYYWFKGIEESV
jgi:hypothetical protein